MKELKICQSTKWDYAYEFIISTAKILALPVIWYAVDCKRHKNFRRYYIQSVCGLLWTHLFTISIRCIQIRSFPIHLLVDSISEGIRTVEKNEYTDMYAHNIAQSGTGTC